MAPSLRELPHDWEFWHILTLTALLTWIVAGRLRFWLMSALQSLAWSLPLLPQASLDGIRPLVNGFVALWFPVAIVSFCVGFAVFHLEAESRRAD